MDNQQEQEQDKEQEQEQEQAQEHQQHEALTSDQSITDVSSEQTNNTDENDQQPINTNTNTNTISDNYNPEQVYLDNNNNGNDSNDQYTDENDSSSSPQLNAINSGNSNSKQNSPNAGPAMSSPTVNTTMLSPSLTGIASPTSSSASAAVGISSVMPAIGKRLNVQIDTLEARITNDKYDTEAWTLLLNEVQSQPITIARDIYERFLIVFPTAGRYWKLYVEQEMASKNYDMVEKIFLRSLRNVRNVELWKCYITYIRQIKGDSNKEEVVKAFELAIEYIGLDISSTPIWTEYLAFLKEDKAATPAEEGSKKNAIRKLYQRAIENPMHDLDILWREYEQFEQANGNKNLAKNLLTDHSVKYQHAKTVYRERKALLEGILRNMLAKPPRATDKEEHQVRLWRKLIGYEKTNPQRFEQVQLRQRITATYNQCLLCLYHYPDIWFEAATYQADSNNLDMATSFYERAIQAIPNNLFLHFCYADFLEINKKIAQAKEVYEKLVTPAALAEVSHNPLVWIQYMRFARRTERLEGPRKIFKRAKSHPECTYHVYIALGFIEHYVNQDTKTAREIFELGLKKFSNEIPYVNFFVDFLTNLNEDNNTRVLFEKILTIIPADKSEIFWRKYMDFEYRQNQDINTIVKLEKRFQQLSPANGKMSIMQVLNRYKFLNLWPCHPNEIEIINKNLNEEDLDIAMEDQAPAPAEQPHHHHGKKKDKHGKNDGEKESKKNMDKPSASTKIPVSNWKTTRPDTTLMIPYRLNEMSKITHPSGGSGAGSSGMGSGDRDSNASPASGNQNRNDRTGGAGGNNNQWQNDNNSNNNMIPDFVKPLLRILPPPNAFRGPWIDVDTLMMLISDTPLPNNPSIMGGGSGGGMGGGLDTPMSNNPTKQPSGSSSGGGGTSNQPNKSNKPMNQSHKRKVDNNNSNDNDNEDSHQTSQPHHPHPHSHQPTVVNKPPEHDIYRKRQASKLSKRT